MVAKIAWIDVMKTPEDSGSRWTPEELVSTAMERARTVVSPDEIAKTEVLLAKIFGAWATSTPELLELVRIVYPVRPSHRLPFTMESVRAYTMGEVLAESLEGLQRMTRNTYLTPVGALVIMNARFSQHPVEEARNLKLVDGPDERAIGVFNDFVAQLEEKLRIFQLGLEAVADDTIEQPLIRARAIVEMGDRLSREFRAVYEAVHVAKFGHASQAGRKIVLHSDEIDRSVDHFVKTKLLGFSASDPELHGFFMPRSPKDHQEAASRIIKANQKIISAIKHYHEYLCYFFDTPEGPFRSDQLVLSKPPGRPASDKN